jgi:hypothetical protein
MLNIPKSRFRKLLVAGWILCVFLVGATMYFGAYKSGNHPVFAAVVAAVAFLVAGISLLRILRG